MRMGSNTIPKNELIIFLMIVLLLEGRVDSKIFMIKYNLSNKTFYRYISELKNILADFGLYFIDIYYDRKEHIYRCKITL